MRKQVILHSIMRNVNKRFAKAIYREQRVDKVFDSITAMNKEYGTKRKCYTIQYMDDDSNITRTEDYNNLRK